MPHQYVQKRMVSFGRTKKKNHCDALQASKDHMNAAMVSDHITRMEKLDDLCRSNYEAALKHASATAFLGKVLSTVNK